VRAGLARFAPGCVDLRGFDPEGEGRGREKRCNDGVIQHDRLPKAIRKGLPTPRIFVRVFGIKIAHPNSPFSISNN
jgi:hypothetical protein